MIDSVTLRYEMTAEDAEILINSITVRRPERMTQEMIDKFLNPYGDEVLSLPKYSRVECDAVNPGIIEFRFYRHGSDYFFEISFCLEAIIQERRGTRLFVCDPYNIQILQEAYATMMIKIAPVLQEHIMQLRYNRRIGAFEAVTYSYDRSYNLTRLPYLAAATVLRIDYTVNLAVDDKKTYLYLVRKSFLERDRMRLKDEFEGNDNVVATTAKKLSQEEFLALKKSGGKSPRQKSAYTQMTFYDKALKYKEDGCEDEGLISEAEHIVRYELSFRKVNKWDSDRKERILGIRNGRLCGLLPWLDEDVAMTQLRNYYETHIGTEPFLNKYNFNRLIDEHDYGYTSRRAEEKRKQKLLDISMLISRAKTVQLAKKQYVGGTDIGDDFRALKGSESDFYSAIASIKEAGTVPLRLPEYGATKGISRYDNPWQQYEDGYPALPGYLYTRENPEEEVSDVGIKNLIVFGTYFCNVIDFIAVNDVNKGLEDESLLDLLEENYRRQDAIRSVYEKEDREQREETAKILAELDELEAKINQFK